MWDTHSTPPRGLEVNQLNPDVEICGDVDPTCGGFEPTCGDMYWCGAHMWRYVEVFSPHVEIFSGVESTCGDMWRFGVHNWRSVEM